MAAGPLYETIGFAAANRPYIELDYRDERGRRDTRLIEAYSLLLSQAGDTLPIARADSVPRGVSPYRAKISF